MHYNKDFTGIFNIKLKEGSNEWSNKEELQ